MNRIQQFKFYAPQLGKNCGSLKSTLYSDESEESTLNHWIDRSIPHLKKVNTILQPEKLIASEGN